MKNLSTTKKHVLIVLMDNIFGWRRILVINALKVPSIKLKLMPAKKLNSILI
jgi:hypothetical protein